MPKNKIIDLRNHLFATLEALQDEENPMDIERAKAISIVSKQIIETGKLEVNYLKIMGSDTGTGFIINDDQKKIE